MTITGQGDTKHCASTLKYLSQEMSREDAAKVAYQTLTALAEKEGGGGGGGVEGKGATGTGIHGFYSYSGTLIGGASADTFRS